MKAQKHIYSVYGDAEKAKGWTVPIIKLCLLAPNLPINSLLCHVRAGTLQTTFLLCQPASGLVGSDKWNTGWKLESVVRGENLALCYD